MALPLWFLILFILSTLFITACLIVLFVRKSPRGPQGPQGDQGEIGFTGPRGLQGPQGPASTGIVESSVYFFGNGYGATFNVNPDQNTFKTSKIVTNKLVTLSSAHIICSVNLSGVSSFHMGVNITSAIADVRDVIGFSGYASLLYEGTRQVLSLTNVTIQDHQLILYFSLSHLDVIWNGTGPQPQYEISYTLTYVTP